MEILEVLVLRVKKALKGHRVPEALLEQTDLMEMQDQKVNLALWDRPEDQDQLEMLDLMVIKA